MPIPAARLDADNKLVPFTEDDVAALGLESRGIRDGSGGRRSMKMGGSTRTYQWLLTDPTKFWDAVVYLCGAVSRATNGSGNYYLSRIMPWVDPEEPQRGITELTVNGLAFTQDNTDGDIPVPEYGAIDIEALGEILPFPLEEDIAVDQTESYRYVQELPDVANAQYLSMPGVSMGLRFRTSGATAPDNISVPYNTGFPFIKSRVSRKWWRVPAECLASGTAWFKRMFGDPATSTRPYVGSCNKTDFLGYRAGTLILLAPEREIVYDFVSGNYCYNVTFHWDWLPHGANNLYYFKSSTSGGTSGWYLASRAAWAAVTDLGDEDVLFPPREHLDIFDVGTV